MSDLNKRLKFGYEDTDKSIEIDLYGLVFEINNLDSIEELESLDKDDKSIIEAQIEKLLGQGAIEKINNKRKSDGYKELDLNIELNILGCIMQTYANAMGETIKTGVFDRVINETNKINNEVNKFNSREQRRNYNKNQYRGNKRNYRRY